MWLPRPTKARVASPTRLKPQLAAAIETPTRQFIPYDIFMRYYRNNRGVYPSILETLAIVREPLMFRRSYFNAKFRLLR